MISKIEILLILPDSGSRCDINTTEKELISAIDFWSMNPELL